MSTELIGVVGYAVFFGDDSPWNDNSVGCCLRNVKNKTANDD